MAFLSCEQIDTIFRMAERQVSKDLGQKRMSVQNAYFGRINEGSDWPLHAGTEMNKATLGRMGVPTDSGWSRISDTLCATNACDMEYDVIYHGFEETGWSIARRGLRTDWLCIDSLALRQSPEKEVAAIESGLQDAASYVHEEFRRSRYLDLCRHHVVGLVDVDGNGDPVQEYWMDDATNLNHVGWVFERRASGEMDENHVRVCVPNAHINRISRLTPDMLDVARQVMIYEDPTYLDNTGLMEALVAGANDSKWMAQIERQQLGGVTADGVSNLVDLRMHFGIDRVVRNYAVKPDFFAMRFFPDVAFNTALLAEVGYAFDENDPSSWPRFKRVHAYVPKKSKIAGIEYVPNPTYQFAPFGISTLMNTNVMTVHGFPEYLGTGSAKKAENYAYDGRARWRNPDWECNSERNKGFWAMKFMLAAEPEKVQTGYAYFHALNNKVMLAGHIKTLPTAPAVEAISPYCYAGMAGGDYDEELGVNAAVSNAE